MIEELVYSRDSSDTPMVRKVGPNYIEMESNRLPEANRWYDSELREVATPWTQTSVFQTDDRVTSATHHRESLGTPHSPTVRTLQYDQIAAVATQDYSGTTAVDEEGLFGDHAGYT